MSQRGRTGGGLLGNVVLAIASPIVFFMGLELLARAAGLTPPLILWASPATCTRHDARFGYSLRPSCEGTLSDTPLVVNAAGLRGPELRDDGAYRLLAIGDSCTFGYQVPEQAAYPAVLQRLLEARRGAGRYEVLNGGFLGYTSLHGLRFLQERGMAWRPQVVIAAYMWNDIAPGPDVERQLDLPPPSPLVERLDDFFIVHSRLYQWVQALGSGALPTWVGAVPRQPSMVTVDRYARNLRGMVRVAEAGGARIAFIHWGVGALPYQAALEDVAAEAHAPLVRYDGPRLDLIHPTAQGYETLAEQIYEALDRAGYLERTNERTKNEKGLTS